eukprot:768083-Hanusia_phi.AAC.1
MFLNQACLFPSTRTGTQALQAWAGQCRSAGYRTVRGEVRPGGLELAGPASTPGEERASRVHPSDAYSDCIIACNTTRRCLGSPGLLTRLTVTEPAA